MAPGEAVPRASQTQGCLGTHFDPTQLPEATWRCCGDPAGTRGGHPPRNASAGLLPCSWPLVVASTVACSQSHPSSVQLWHPISFGIPPNPACRAPLDWTRQQSGTAERWGGIHLGHPALLQPPQRSTRGHLVSLGGYPGWHPGRPSPGLAKHRVVSGLISTPRNCQRPPGVAVRTRPGPGEAILPGTPAPGGRRP